MKNLNIIAIASICLLTASAAMAQSTTAPNGAGTGASGGMGAGTNTANTPSETDGGAMKKADPNMSGSAMKKSNEPNGANMTTGGSTGTNTTN